MGNSTVSSEPVMIGFSAEDETVNVIAKEIAVRLLAHPKFSTKINQRAGKPEALGQFARRLLKERRRRDEVFHGNLFGEPAWDMLLDLFASAEEGKNVSVSSLCVAAAVPATTGLRHMNYLLDSGWILRKPDQFDARRVHIELSLGARQELKQLLESWMKGDEP